MTNPQRFLADGEKLSSAQINETHVQHPRVGSFFQRSTLLIGTRGVGKTFLLRHRKMTAHPDAIYINLVSCLQSLSKDSGIGGRTLEFNSDLISQIGAKTSALIAIAVLEQLLKDSKNPDFKFPLRLLEAVLPEELRVSDIATLESIKAIRLKVNQFRLKEWPKEFFQSWSLISTLEEICEHYGKKVPLFLDRAEDVPAPALKVIFPLLDQSVSFLVVIAARPGLAQLIPAGIDPTSVPGDHFDIVHLGSNPYDDDWIEFSRIATIRFLNENNIVVQENDSFLWAMRFGRDSVRAAIGYTQISVETSSKTELNRRLQYLKSHREYQLKTIAAELQPENADYRYTIKAIQNNFPQLLTLESQKPVLIETEVETEQLSLLRGNSQLVGYLLKAIRSEAIFLPPGQLWHPYELPAVFEVPPLFVWRSENSSWIS